MQVLRIAWFLDMIYTKFARLGYQSLFQVILECQYFVFKIVLPRIEEFSAVFLLLRNISASNEGLSGEKWVFLCLRGGYVSIFRVYKDLEWWNFAVQRGQSDSTLQVLSESQF